MQTGDRVVIIACLCQVRPEEDCLCFWCDKVGTISNVSRPGAFFVQLDEGTALECFREELKIQEQEITKKHAAAFEQALFMEDLC